MSNTVSGSCLCGINRFSIEGSFDAFYLCHCNYCRKDTGSAHAANLFSKQAKLIWHEKSKSIKQFNLAGTKHSKCFCSECGSALPFEQAINPHTNMLVVPAGSLDQAVNMHATAHLFCRSRAVWDNALENIQQYDSLP
jgi:hypothetical protein